MLDKANMGDAQFVRGLMWTWQFEELTLVLHIAGPLYFGASTTVLCTLATLPVFPTGISTMRGDGTLRIDAERFYDVTPEAMRSMANDVIMAARSIRTADPSVN
jgi:hypothetical protein